MKIISWNVNGLRSVYGKGFLDFVKEQDPDILCLQEVKANEGQLPLELTELGGYNLYFNSAEKKGYGGVAVYSKCKPIVAEFDIGFERFDGEGRMIILEYSDFVLVNFYLPHGGRDKSNLGYKLESYDFVIEKIQEIFGKGKEVVVCGDFNVAREEIDLARPWQNRKNIMFTNEEREKIRKFCDCGLRDSFREVCGDEVRYSCWPYMANCRERNVGWRIDYVFVSEGLMFRIQEAFVLDEVMGSDHCPVGIKLK